MITTDLAQRLQLQPTTDIDIFPSFAWPGGYPMFYVSNGQPLCPECANLLADNYFETISEFDINWEDAELYCDECSRRIESAYAEEEAID